jgi:hypothetical protein
MYIIILIMMIMMISIYMYYVECYPFTSDTILVTSSEPQRYINFEGHPKEIHSRMITHVTKHYQTMSLLTCGVPECASRTLANLYNLRAVRGNLIDGTLDLQSSMSGPHFYYGFLDPKDTHTIVIDIHPKYYRHSQISPISTVGEQVQETNIIKLINFKWISGSTMSERDRDYYNMIIQKRNYIDPQSLDQDSLFEHPGVLLTELQTLVIDPIRDPYNYDLSTFRVQVVPNDVPFRFTLESIDRYPHAQHKLRVISYYYGSRYVPDYLMNGNGIFIERHDFIQAITPLHPTCSGYVIVGRIQDDNLQLIAITIPYNYTLLVEPQAIHGDSNLIGMYSMAMTGNHLAMGTADTVYLKNKYHKPLAIEFLSDQPITPVLPLQLTPKITSNELTSKQLDTHLQILRTQITDPLVINPEILRL